MEESKVSTVKQAQAGDDSGYSCTSTQSKSSVKSCHSQSASSGDSCFEERMSTTLETTQNEKKMSTLHSKSPEKQNDILPKNVSNLETINNQESNNNSSKPDQINLTFEPEPNQLLKNYDVSELKQPSSVTKIELDETSNLNNTIRESHDQNNTSFLQLTTLYEPYCDYTHTNDLSSNHSDKSTISNMASKKELNEQQIELEDIFEFNEIPEESFGVIVSMNDGLIINTSTNIHKSMGYPKNMWKGRLFTDFIHPKDSMAFINYVTTILKDPCVISKQDNLSTVTFLKSKNNDGFYCNMRKYKCLNTGYSISQTKYLYQVCKLTITFKDVSCSSVSPCPIKNIVSRPQLILIIKAQLIHSAYTHSGEKKENPLTFITKYNTLLEWCYVDHLTISYLGYLPQNILGTSIFNYYKKEDLTTIKDIHDNMIKSKSVPYKEKPYWFKCQNGDFALVQTEWSNFVNPWSGQVEFVIGKHKVIQGPINPGVTIPVDNFTSEAESNIFDNKKKPELNEDINKILNKNINEVTGISLQKNQLIDLKTNVKQQISEKLKDMASFMNSLVDSIDPSAHSFLKVEVQPETCGSFSDHNSVMLGEMSPYHNYERKSSSGTSPSYTQLNYNDNIQRFFKSNLKSSTSDDMKTEMYSTEITTEDEVTPPDMNTDKVIKDICPLHQSVIPNLNTNDNQKSTDYYSEHNSNHNHQQPLTKKMLMCHTKKMEDDLLKQHKNNANKIKLCEKQNLPDGTIDTPNIIHGTKRCNSSSFENKSYKLTKRKYTGNSNNLTDVITEAHKSEETTATIPVIPVTKICPPCRITRDSQTTFDLPRAPVLSNQVLSYNTPYGDNVMPAKHKEYENTCVLMDPYIQNQEPLSSQLQTTLPVPFFASIPVINHIPQNAHIVQPCLHYDNQLLLPQPNKDIQNENLMEQNKTPITISKTFHHQVNQEDITSSDSECKREGRSYKSSSEWVREDSSFYSSSLRDKTDSSEKEFQEYSWTHQFIKKQPFWMEDVVSTPDLIYRYQIESKDLDEVLRKDMNSLNTLSQPLLVNEQLKQLYTELDINGYSKTSYFEDGTSSSSEGDDCLISIRKHKKRKTDFFRIAMIHEENAPFPPSTSHLLHISMPSNINQLTS